MKTLQSIKDIASVVMLPMRCHASSFEPEEGNMMVLTLQHSLTRSRPPHTVIHHLERRNGLKRDKSGIRGRSG